jgi:hypothetical protein
MVFRQDTAGYREVDPEGAHDDASIYDVYYSESPLRVKAERRIRSQNCLRRRAARK